MDDKLNALDKLIESVEAGGDLPEIGHGYWQFLPAGACILAARTYHEGSLDDALALHEALLPGFGIFTLRNRAGREGFEVHMQDKGRAHADAICVSAEGTTPARAWLLAILRAYRSVQA